MKTQIPALIYPLDENTNDNFLVVSEKYAAVMSGDVWSGTDLDTEEQYDEDELINILEQSDFEVADEPMPADILDAVKRVLPVARHITTAGIGDMIKDAVQDAGKLLKTPLDMVKGIPKVMKMHREEKKKTKQGLLDRIKGVDKYKKLGEALEKHKKFYENLEKATDKGEILDIDLKALDDMLEADPKWADKFDLNVDTIATVVELERLVEKKVLSKGEGKDTGDKYLSSEEISEEIKQYIMGRKEIPDEDKRNLSVEVKGEQIDGWKRKATISAGPTLLAHLVKLFGLEIKDAKKDESGGFSTCPLYKNPYEVKLSDIADEVACRYNSEDFLSQLGSWFNKVLGVKGKLNENCIRIDDDDEREDGSRILVFIDKQMFVDALKRVQNDEKLKMVGDRNHPSGNEKAEGPEGFSEKSQPAKLNKLPTLDNEDLDLKFD